MIKIFLNLLVILIVAISCSYFNFSKQLNTSNQLLKQETLTKPNISNNRHPAVAGWVVQDLIEKYWPSSDLNIAKEKLCILQHFPNKNDLQLVKDEHIYEHFKHCTSLSDMKEFCQNFTDNISTIETYTELDIFNWCQRIISKPATTDKTTDPI